jgi:2-polyprenyl-3-methyl-5-hydroxy-6-metoxy-1,4-benzoquinol methylase
MIIQIKSENKYLLDILNRNPNTDFGLYAKTLKNGVVIGNCITQNQYDIVFQDKKYSYLPEESNQIDFQSYVSPLAILHITNEFFSILLKSKEEYLAQSIKWLSKNYQEVDNETCTIKVASFFIDSNWVRNEQFLLSKYFPQVVVHHKIGNNYELTIIGKNVFESINLLNLVAVFVHITNNYGIFTFIDDSFAEKYARVLTNIDNVPYFVFYLFIKKAIKSHQQFDLLKPVLENYFTLQNVTVDFKYGYNHQERVNYIVNRLNLENEILDVGCGEYIYYRKLTKMGYEKTYFAIDEDPAFEEMSKNVMQKLYTDNLKYFQNLDNFETIYNHQKLDIILTEVIEHNSEEEAKKLIEKLMTLNFNQIFISTPNKDFNHHYFENPEDMRHDDHDFEMTSQEFNVFMNQFQTIDVQLTFDQIGDSINQTCPTQICIISKIKNHD